MAFFFRKKAETIGCAAAIMGIITIKDNRLYREIYKLGKYRADNLLVVYRLPNGTDGFRFGFTVSRKVGGAVVRNRVRRRLKEICRLHQGMFAPGYDYVIIARPRAAGCDYNVLSGSLLKLVEYLG